MFKFFPDINTDQAVGPKTYDPEYSNQDQEMEEKLSNLEKRSITEMSCIRVIVNVGRGFGHQRAAITLMQKLREIGFAGVFDIQCDDRIGAERCCSKTQRIYKNNEPAVTPQLVTMIPGINLAVALRGDIQSVPALGEIKLSSLPEDYLRNENFKLSPVDLAVCAGDDKCNNDFDLNRSKLFGAKSYIGLQPTDWFMGSCFVTEEDGRTIKLPSASMMRLSSATSQSMPINIASVDTTPTETRILAIAADARINSQLIYGLYPSHAIFSKTGLLTKTGHLDECTQMQRIIEAHVGLGNLTGKPSVLLLPQKIALDKSFRNAIRRNNVYFVDLTQNHLDLSEYHAGNIIIAYIGYVQQTVFDHLLLQGTTLPPVIEGCNAREICESAGRPFIHGSGQYDKLIPYPVTQTKKQDLHCAASLCLEEGDPELTIELLQYMYESMSSYPELLKYHEERRKYFLDRPDACELALDTLEINYNKSPKTEINVNVEQYYRIHSF